MTPTVPGDPAVLEPLDKLADASKRSTVIFLHGLGDDGHGTGYGLAQQFQRYQKLRYTRWVLPTATIDPEVGERCWYKPHELPSALKPRVPGREGADGAEVDASEDEEGILKAVAYVDELVKGEVDRGVEPGKIAVGGFSQGCAVSMVWGLRGQWRDKVAGVFGLSGYLPNINAVSEAGKGSEGGGGQHAPRWFFGHGMGDGLVSVGLFADGQNRLQQYVEEESIEGHVYQDLGHDVGTSEVRDLWLWFKQVLKDDS